MTDRELELLLEGELSSLPPDDELVSFITPWRQAIRRILVGMALCGVTLNFFLLDYLLPAIGTVLMLLGFRSLRRENRWFTLGYWTAVGRTGLNTLSLILNATVLDAGGLALWITITGIALTTLHALCVWGGFRAVQEKAGTKKTSRGFWLVVYYIVLSVLAFIGIQSLVMVLVLLAVYILLLRILWKYAGFLEDAGYAMEASPLRLSDRTVAIAISAVTLLGILGGYLFSNQYPMDWTPQAAVSAEAQDVKVELLELGFPAGVLEDLSEEDLLACRGAAVVHVRSQEFGIHEHEYDPEAGDWYDYQTVHEKELRMTQIAVEVPGERRQFILFHHFLWKTDPGYQGCDAIQLWNTDRIEGWYMSRPIAGRVLYDYENASYHAPFYTIIQTSGIETVASFSLPRDAENRRGYLTYTIEEISSGWLLDSVCHYYHQTSPLLYPARTAADIIRPGLGGVWIDMEHWFAEYWNQIQLVPRKTDDGSYAYEFTF